MPQVIFYRLALLLVVASVRVNDSQRSCAYGG